MNFTEAIWTGIIAGVLTSALLFILTKMTQVVVLPWFRQLIYRGVTISGRWTETIDHHNGHSQQLSTEIKQKADYITGAVSIVKLTEGVVDSAVTFELEGNISDRLVTLTMRPSDTSRLGRAVVLLEVIGDGTRMEGRTTWYDAGAATIQSVDTAWIRS